ncbi:hypothetical protein SHKM778_84100 [Streptomyces sp. KM77-8]|uniref:PDZ domain-containing protein n=1 Tax=Streptomyces haneummycinicus TaxID=3074435 RepID=A0AAT9HWF8_9ACTN
MSGRALFCQPRRIGRGAALTLVFASVLVAGAATGSLPEADGKSRADGAPSAVPVGQDVARAAEEAAADGTSPMEAAQRAVSRSGDRWAAVYSPGEYEEFEETLDGRYTGVGLWAREREGRIEVTKVGDGTPAAGAGIRAGDRLRSVDGEKVDGRPVTEVVSLLRGRATGDSAGTTVRLGLERGTRAWHETVRRVRLTRDAVTVRELPPGSRSSRWVPSPRARATRSAPPYARPRPAPASSSTCAATPGTGRRGRQRRLRLPRRRPGRHVRRRGRAARPARRTRRRHHQTLVALVDGGTMSAAELLTGALQDRGRAVVVGSRTFGKGSVQMPTELPDGSVAELTVGHYRTPRAATSTAAASRPTWRPTERPCGARKRSSADSAVSEPPIIGFPPDPP